MSQSLNPIFQNYSFIVIGGQAELVYSLREDLLPVRSDDIHVPHLLFSAE